MSDKSLVSEFDDLADVFWRLGVMQSPSQLHGWLSGQLAVGAECSNAQWLQQVHTFLDPVVEFSEPDCQLLLHLLDVTQAQISADTLDFKLLLPDDRVEIGQRVDSLAQWCHGFLAGFAAAGRRRQQAGGKQDYSSELSEALSDMAAISQVELAGEEADLENSEKDYYQIIEYLRVAAVNTYLECNQVMTGQGRDQRNTLSGDGEGHLSGNKTVH